ncbi:type-F conjugative transfer system pilin assembly protein TrbC [Acinetobacter sp. P1(2025)]|uniref:type-F conjugative transfer system pilin assembly protein TrbC n=1 Tax=Acinetobacter sp. P1(2025) TaxID=3446120 RepID=UPI003F52B8EC
MKKSLLSLVLFNMVACAAYAAPSQAFDGQKVGVQTGAMQNQVVGTVDIDSVRKNIDLSGLDDKAIEAIRKKNQQTIGKAVVQSGVDVGDVKTKAPDISNVRLAEPKVPDYINDKELEKQRGMIDLTKITKQYNDALVKDAQKQNKHDSLSDFEVGRAYLFISATIPKTTLEKLLNDAGKYNVAVFLKGNIGDDPLKFAGTQAFMQKLKIDTPPELYIHPDAFKMFKIDKVPALVVAASDAKDRLDEQGCADLSDYDIVYGDLDIAYNLNKIYENASSPDIKDVARQYQKFIKAGAVTQ